MTDNAGKHYVTGCIESPAGCVTKVSTSLNARDRLDGLKVRFAINRFRYMVDPGLYAAGLPSPESPVFVTANYKLTFDILRKNLPGIDSWILVLDTKGINVWCAAGKGTFGTEELVHRIKTVQLDKIITHRKLILPQLGATGVAGHKVKERSGFSVIFGPVRASDIPAFMNAGKKATPAMRRVNFTLWDRLVLTPVELVSWGKYCVVIMAVFFLLAGLTRHGYSIHSVKTTGFRAITNLFMSLISGSFLGPMLLPWIPGRSFSFKGFFLGLLAALILVYSQLPGIDTLESISWILLIPSISSFLLMNFTGTSTYTSLSGVRKEMRIAVPVQLAAAIIGLILWIVARFV